MPRRCGEWSSALERSGTCLSVSRGELAYRKRTDGRRPDSRGLKASLRIADVDLLLRVREKREPRDSENLGKRRSGGALRNACETRDTERLARKGRRAALQKWRGEVPSSTAGEPPVYRIRRDSPQNVVVD
jgi:hypothetical protein